MPGALLLIALTLPADAHVGECASAVAGSPVLLPVLPPPPRATVHVVLDVSTSMEHRAFEVLEEICAFQKRHAAVTTARMFFGDGPDPRVIPLDAPCAAARPDLPKRRTTPLRSGIDEARALVGRHPGDVVVLVTDGWNDASPAAEVEGPLPEVPSGVLVVSPNDDAAKLCGYKVRQEEPSCPDLVLRPRTSLGSDLASALPGAPDDQVLIELDPNVSVLESPRGSRPAAAPPPRGVVAVLGAGGLCTGLLVREDVVLTAAHCLPAREIEIAPDARGRTLRVAVGSVSAHPGELDVALLRLASPLVGVDPVEVWRSPLDGPPNGELRAFGFGARARTTSLGAWTLQEVDLVVQGWGCDRERPGATGCRPGAELLVPPQGGADTCRGDSGGPLMELVPVLEPGVGRRCGWRLVGVTSRSLRGADCGQGGIYVRADAVASWVRHTLSDWR